MKKKFKWIFLLIFILILISLLNLVNQGNHGRGALAFLAYMQKPVQLTEDIYEVNVESFDINIDGQKLVGTTFIPNDGLNQHKTIVFSHGFNCQSQLLQNKAISLAQSGITVVTFDFRGGSVNGLSDGATEEMTVSSEIADLDSVVNFVLEKGLVSDTELYLMGESFGGLISALEATNRDDVKGLILCFPALHSADAARNLWTSEEDIPKTLDIGNMPTGQAYWKELYNLDIYEEISGYTGETIILHGLSDQNVDYNYSVKANEVYSNSELFLIEGAGHGFGNEDAVSSLKTIYHFVTKK